MSSHILIKAPVDTISLHHNLFCLHFFKLHVQFRRNSFSRVCCGSSQFDATEFSHDAFVFSLSRRSHARPKVLAASVNEGVQFGK